MVDALDLKSNVFMTCRFESDLGYHRCFNGVLAQPGERLLCKQEVSGSIPLYSTNTEV